MSILDLFLILHTGSIHLTPGITPAAFFVPRVKEKVQRCLQIGMAGEEHYKNA